MFNIEKKEEEVIALYHSHKKRKDSLETRAVYIENPLVSWNLPNGPKHRASVLKNMASSEGDQLLAGAFPAIVGKIEAGILQIAKNWNWKWIFMCQGYIFRKIPAVNASFASKYAHLQGWPLRFGQYVKIFQSKYWNAMQEQTQVNKKRFVFEQYRQTNQRMMNVRKKQFKSFEISGEEI